MAALEEGEREREFKEGGGEKEIMVTIKKGPLGYSSRYPGKPNSVQMTKMLTNVYYLKK